MASASTCCILLVYGIPGSGKSLLTDYLCSESVSVPWPLLPLHFDSFYPPDTRTTPVAELVLYLYCVILPYSTYLVE